MTSEVANRGSALGVRHEDEVVLQDSPVKGVNNRWGNTRKLDPGESPELLNVTLEDQSTPAKRDGFAEVESGHKPFAPPALRGGLFAELDLGPNSRLMVAGFPGGNTYVTHSPDGPTWTYAGVVEDPTGTIARDMDITSDRAKAIQGNGLLWLVTPGTGTPIHTMGPDGFWRDCGSGNLSPPTDAVDGVYMLARMWFIAGNRLYWSKLLPVQGDLLPEPSAFDLTNSTPSGSGGFIELSPEQGAEPVAIVGWREESLIIFFKNQIEEVVINPSDPLLSTRKRLEGNIGCGARDSVVQVGDDIYFLDQYGQYRSLRRNQLGNDQGVISLPVSEAFRAEMPGNLNKQFMYRTQAALLEEFLYVCFPSGSSESPDRWMVLDLGRGSITGPWSMSSSFSRLLVSDIEGGGFRMYGLGGEALSRVYRFFDGRYTDDGTAIQFRHTTKAFDMGIPQSDKTPAWYDVEFVGEVGATASLEVRTSENDAWTTVATKAVESKVEEDWPLLETDFPLLAADFPLVGSDPKITSMKGCFDETNDGDLPLYAQDLPIVEADLPIGAGGGIGAGRVVQWRVSNSTDESYFEEFGVRVAIRPNNIELEVEP